MRIAIIYRQQSDHARPVYEFIETMRRRYPDKKIVEVEIDTRDGAAEATMYGIMRYPAIVATAYDGRILGLWEGLPMPLIDEIVGATIDQQSASV